MIFLDCQDKDSIMLAVGDKLLKRKDVTSYLRLRIAVVVAIVGVLLPGCAVGPDFRSPKAPSTNAYTATPLPEKTAAAPGIGGAAQCFVPGQDIPAQWWTLFHSEALDQLIHLALADSPTLAAAQAKLREAQENRRAQVGVLFSPTVDANFSAEREKISGAAFGQTGTTGTTFNLYNASVSVSYLLDIFGGGRRELESLQSQVDYQRFQLEGSYLTLTSNIVTAAVREASLRSQIRATREILTAQEKQLDVVECQFQLGGVSRSEVLAQRTQVAQTRATLPPLEKELSQTRHQLAVLAGMLPSEAALPEFELDSLQLPQELPVSLPSSLVRQRPDIAASEALHAASAQVGVATANLYPQITLTGSYGSEAITIGTLFNNGPPIWNVGAGLLAASIPGRRAFSQAPCCHRIIRTGIFAISRDSFAGVPKRGRCAPRPGGGCAWSRSTGGRRRCRERYTRPHPEAISAGRSGLSPVLIAERQYQQARISLVQAQAARFADTAALFQALGGGWWNRRPDDDITATRNKE